MLRYEKGAIATNCTSSSKPEDIYLNVLEAVKEKLQGTTTGWDWIKLGLDRALIKTIIMTIPYGCTQYRAEEIIVQWYYSKDSSLFEGRLRHSASYLALAIVGMFYKIYPEYSRLMVFLESVPRQLKSPMVWVSPSGFPVYQAYYKSTAKRVKSLLFGRIRSVVYREETGKLDTAKMSRAFTPNLIHCLDAAVLHMALARTEAPAVAAVHDSFAAHASEIGGLVNDVKASYMEIFGGDSHDFWRKIFTSDMVEDQGLSSMAGDFSSLVGDFSVDGILTAGYMYR
jgi:DNA-directed RNA polymerase